MALITVPAKLSFTSVEGFTLSRNTSILRSKFTGQSQRVLYPFAIWMIKAKLKDYAPEDAGAIRGFLAALRGSSNTFQLRVPGYVKSGAWQGYLAAFNAAVRATSILLDASVAANGIVLFKAGDYFTIQDELKIVTADVVVPSNGQALVTFEPPLRKAVSGSPNVNHVTPYCLMHASDDDVASWGIRAPVIHSFDLDGIEAIDV